MGKAARLKAVAATAPALLKLDFGCGPHKRDGFIGVDAFPFVGVDQVVDLKARYSGYEDGPASAVSVDPAHPDTRPLRRSGQFKPWPWADGSVEEAHASHFLEHLTSDERCHFVNELFRVLVPGGKCQIIVPHWASNRAYGDPTHQWPPVSEMWFYYLSKDWRIANAPHTDASVWAPGFGCDFVATWGYAMRQDLTVRNQEFQQYALANFKEAAQDTIATLVKKV